MNNSYGFNTEYCSMPANNNIKITYVPSSDIVYYTYNLYKNSNLVRTVTLDSGRLTNIFLDSTGKYYVSIEAHLQDGSVKTETSCEYIVDKEKPILTIGKENLTLIKGNTIDVMGNVSARDNIDGDITSFVVTNIDELDLKSLGKKKLTYTVSDKAGNTTVKSTYINVTEDPVMLFVLQGIVIVSLMFVLAYIIRYCRSLNLEKRIEKYSINPLIDDKDSIYDSIRRFFRKVIDSIKPTFNKSVFLTRLSKRYEKYIGLFEMNDAMDFVTVKFIFSILLLFIAACSKAVQFKLIGFYEIWIPLCIGFFLPDILFISKYKIYRNLLENDLLQAIVIMNNAFKSGRSITQAIILVSSELKGPIAKEFKKMAIEISLGLSVEEVFRRFSKRIDMEEVTYLTASLSIINKTGGNIIRVFNSIEKTLVNKKKLRLELNSLTSGSKIIVNVLFFVPLLFVLFVGIVSPDYFMPFITNPFGILMLVLIILLYIIYIIVIKQIMKVRM